MDHEIQATTNPVDHNFALCTLVNALKEFSECQPFCIPEIACLDKFPMPEVLIPIELFSPRQVIEEMMKKHGRTMDYIWEVPSHLETYVYKYRFNERTEEFVFSNNMVFYADVITICYLHYIRAKYEWPSQLWDLIMIMKRKYDINDGRGMNLSPSSATFFRIAHSFPSVTLGMFYHVAENFPIFPCTAFPEFNLSNVFCSPMIASLIPILPCDENIPLALLTATAILLYDNSKYGSVRLTKLDVVYKRIMGLYTSKAFPAALKISLCQKWGIVHTEGYRYRYTPDIIASRERAKAVISILRSQDIHLQYILSYM